MSAPRFLLLIACVTFVALIGLALLPQDPYQRFAAAANESKHYLRIQWIYQRIHFDPTPIDVAFIGTSHTQSAIDSRIVEAELRRRGLAVHVVNFAVPHLGRDLHWLLVRELLEARAVRELVVEVQDFEPRAPHPAFQRLGRPGDLLGAPLIIDTGYFDNLVRLPRRQLDVAWPRISGRLPIDPATEAYEGPHWDDTERLHGFAQSRDGTHTAQFLDEKADALRVDLEQKEALARRIAMPDGCSLLKRYNRTYLEKLLALAREKDVHVTFLYLPFFHGPAQPTEARYYQAYGETIVPQAVLDDSGAWLNADHLNVFGARRVSSWVGRTLSMVQNAPAAPSIVAPCY